MNQPAYSKQQGEYFAKLLEKAVLHVFTQGDVVAFAADGPRWNRNYIGNNMLQVHIEVGPKMSRVHAHVIQEIKHRTVLNIDQQDARDAINEYISEQTGGRVDKCFVSRKIHPSAMPLEEYADKDNKDWKHTGEVPTLTSTYILKFGGKTAREELEEEDERAYESFIATLQPVGKALKKKKYSYKPPPKPIGLLDRMPGDSGYGSGGFGARGDPGRVEDLPPSWKPATSKNLNTSSPDYLITSSETGSSQPIINDDSLSATSKRRKTAWQKALGRAGRAT